MIAPAVPTRQPRIAELETQAQADIEAYEKAGPLWQSYLGLKRYWDKRREAEAALI